MAKQGTITAPTGADENLKTLGEATPVRDTLAGVVRSALQLASALKKAVINFGVRKAVIVPAAQSLVTVESASGVDLAGTFSPDDATKSSSPFTFAGTTDYPEIEALLAGLVEERKPSFSVEALVNRIDELNDQIAAGLTAAENTKRLQVVIDQGTGVVRVSTGSEASIAGAHTAAVALAEDVQYVQTLSAPGEKQFGE